MSVVTENIVIQDNASIITEDTLTQENKKIKIEKKEKWTITFFFVLDIESEEDDSFNLELKNGLEIEMDAITVKGYIDNIFIGTYEEADEFNNNVIDYAWGSSRKFIVDIIFEKYFKDQNIDNWEMRAIEPYSIEKYVD
jgi:hypothetical protein